MADFILVILAIIILFSVFRRYIAFFLVSAISRKLFNDLNRMNQQQQRGSARGGSREGEIHIDPGASSRSRKSFRNDQGDYVDYEEIKE